MTICTKLTICVAKKLENFHTSGSSILKDMGIFVFICIYRQIQKYQYILKYLSQRSVVTLCCTKCTLCANFHLIWTIYDLFGSMKLLLMTPIIGPLCPPPHPPSRHLEFQCPKLEVWRRRRRKRRRRWRINFPSEDQHYCKGMWVKRVSKSTSNCFLHILDWDNLFT